MNDTELSGQIIGAAIEVHKLLGPGLLESAYEECLCHELHLKGIRFSKQKPVPLVYKGVKLDCGFRLDLLVEERIVVELKSIDGIGPIHEAIVLTYLRLSGNSLALLINFNVPVLKDGIRRFIMSRNNDTVSLNTEATEIAEKRPKSNHA
ncbi:MAG: GxxExxY protein [Acidobacteria bacterium]|nr:GxxExxY protein [Acidobacteriota bacterium]MBS1865840.1 GxxExxY protein [Acidobacteriota bacterium]